MRQLTRIGVPLAAAAAFAFGGDRLAGAMESSPQDCAAHLGSVATIMTTATVPEACEPYIDLFSSEHFVTNDSDFTRYLAPSGHDLEVRADKRDLPSTKAAFILFGSLGGFLVANGLVKEFEKRKPELPEPDVPEHQ